MTLGKILRKHKEKDLSAKELHINTMANEHLRWMELLLGETMQDWNDL